MSSVLWGASPPSQVPKITWLFYTRGSGNLTTPRLKKRNNFFPQGTTKFCLPNKLCTDSKECEAAGRDFVCHLVMIMMVMKIVISAFCFKITISLMTHHRDDIHDHDQASGQCKPSYGSCHTTCDCLDNFGMVFIIIIIFIIDISFIPTIIIVEITFFIFIIICSAFPSTSVSA